MPSMPSVVAAHGGHQPGDAGPVVGVRAGHVADAVEALGEVGVVVADQAALVVVGVEAVLQLGGHLVDERLQVREAGAALGQEEQRAGGLALVARQLDRLQVVVVAVGAAQPCVGAFGGLEEGAELGELLRHRRALGVQLVLQRVAVAVGGVGRARAAQRDQARQLQGVVLQVAARAAQEAPPVDVVDVAVAVVVDAVAGDLALVDPQDGRQVGVLDVDAGVQDRDDDLARRLVGQDGVGVGQADADDAVDVAVEQVPVGRDGVAVRGGLGEGGGRGQQDGGGQERADHGVGSGGSGAPAPQTV